MKLTLGHRLPIVPTSLTSGKRWRRSSRRARLFELSVKNLASLFRWLALAGVGSELEHERATASRSARRAEIPWG